MNTSSYGDTPFVSVCMITYNHEQYIREAIEGVLMQKTDFQIELVIGEDCSSDNTREICIEYQQKYPEIITLRLPEHNLGMMKNLIENLQACSGKYIAFCEGDDYWINPYKLQKQVDFLEANPDAALSCHDALIVYENKERPPGYFTKFTQDLEIDKCTLLNNWMLPSASMVFRSKIIQNMQSWMEEVAHGDLLLHMLAMHHGKMMYMNQFMSVYRVTLHGTSMRAQLQHKHDFLFDKINYLYEKFDEYTHQEYTQLIHMAMSRKREIHLFMKRRVRWGIAVYLVYPKQLYKKIFRGKS